MSTTPSSSSAAANSIDMGNVKLPLPLSLNDSKSDSWKIFKKRWNNFSLLSQLDTKQRELQVAMFENCLADDAIRLLNGFSFTTPEDERTVQQIMDKFEAYAVGEINDTMERFLFHHRVQKEGEDFESFLTDTRRLSQTCKFCDDCKESMIRDRIVLGIRDDDTRQSLLKERNLSLDKCIDVCQAAQSASSHSRAIKPDVVARIEDRSKKPRRNEEILECKFCGTTHPMKKHKCPAYGECCSSCGGENHFAVKCPRKSRNGGKSRGKPDR